MERLSVKPVVTATQTTPVISAIETMYNHGIRSLVVRDGKGRYKGVLLAEHVCDYFGGGEKYDIVVNMFENDFYKALKAPISLLYDDNYPFVYNKEKLTSVLQLMISEGLTLLPVLDDEDRVYGIVSEHDIVGFIAQKKTGVTVSNIMNPHIVSVENDASLREAMGIMLKTGLRSIFVRNEANQIIGTLKMKDIINAVGSHTAFKYIKKGYLDDFTGIPVRELAKYNTLTVPPSMDVGELAFLLNDKQENIALVSSEEEDTPKGMVTEHDVFYALALPI